MDLTDRVIIITGASSGIGAATAIECAKAGLDVVINGRREDRLAHVADLVRQAGRRAVVVAGSVTDDRLSDRLLDATEIEFGRFDAVFANAGYGLRRSVAEETEDELRRIFDVNFFASVDLIKKAANRLIQEHRPGTLLMCSSCLSKFSLPNHAAYAATKAAQNSVCSAMRLELKRHGIHVASVHPITTSTEFFSVADRESGGDGDVDRPGHAPRIFVQPPERVARAIVKCLRRPVPEVWTSTIVKTVAGVMTIFPRFGDWFIARQMARDTE